MIETPQPDDRTLLAAEAMALIAIRQFAINVSSYLATSTVQPGETGAETLERLLELLADTPLDLNATDYQPGPFDLDMAQTIALDKIGDLVRDLRRYVL